MYFLGIDGGGTKCRSAVINEAGEVLGLAIGPCSNWNSVGFESSRAALQKVIDESLEQAKIKHDEVTSMCAGLSGVDRAADKERVLGWFQEMLPKSKHFVYNDGVIALASGTRGILHGVVVISGTGSIATGFHERSSDIAYRASGWGPLLGDVGGGYDIGRQGLVAVARADDGRGPKTVLTELVLKELELTKADDLIGWCYSNLSWERIAALAKLVYEAVRQGDEVAKAILDMSVEGLESSISAVIRKVQFGEDEPFPIVFAGGNLTFSGSLLAAELTTVLKSKYPNCNIVYPSVEPVEAAALIAKQFANK